MVRPNSAPKSKTTINDVIHDGLTAKTPAGHEAEAGDELSWFPAVTTYFGYGLLILFGYVRDFFGDLLGNKEMAEKTAEGYAPLLPGFDAFYIRRLYYRIHDCWNRPINSCPGAKVTCMDRDLSNKCQLTGETRECINLSSYNYLGFANPNSPTKPFVLDALSKYGVSTASPRNTLGFTSLHRDLEQLVARYIGKDDALVFGMGFGTNSTAIPTIMGHDCKGTLIISDELNHSSIVFGARSSGAKVKVFKHNDTQNLESVIRAAITQGQPRTHRPWKKILIIVEGIYSMEGETCPLREIVRIKKKYKCYLFVDEAHSVGAMGANGRGICEHAGVDPRDIDILMGTFTKSFGAVGGYIAGDKDLCDSLRADCATAQFSAGLSPPAVQQVISAFKIIMGEDGSDLGQTKITALHDNANYFRKRLMEMGVQVLGDEDSPVIPVMLGNPAKIPAFSRECYDRNLAVVVVGFPATAILASRVRFCISAGHTREMLDEALEKISEVADRVHIKYNHKFTG